jgi:hypothetical protein
MNIYSKFLFMKTFSVLILLCACLFFSTQAQEQSYVPNARQAVQKSRMQQSQYFELTKNPVNNQHGLLQAASNGRQVNYQLDRPVAIDGPKRRGKKSGESTFAKLANNSKR